MNVGVDEVVETINGFHWKGSTLQSDGDQLHTLSWYTGPIRDQALYTLSLVVLIRLMDSRQANRFTNQSNKINSAVRDGR